MFDQTPTAQPGNLEVRRDAVRLGGLMFDKTSAAQSGNHEALRNDVCRTFEIFDRGKDFLARGRRDMLLTLRWRCAGHG